MSPPELKVLCHLWHESEKQNLPKHPKTFQVINFDLSAQLYCINQSSPLCVPGSNSWQVVSAGGAVVQGGYGHSSVYDQASGCVFVHGGYKALSNNKYGLVDHMYRYHVHTKTW